METVILYTAFKDGRVRVLAVGYPNLQVVVDGFRLVFVQHRICTFYSCEVVRRKDTLTVVGFNKVVAHLKSWK
jgi:hypothetical protein